MPEAVRTHRTSAAVHAAQFAAVRDMLGQGTDSISQIAKATGVKLGL
jgi:hypothetical protein